MVVAFLWIWSISRKLQVCDIVYFELCIAHSGFLYLFWRCPLHRAMSNNYVAVSKTIVLLSSQYFPVQRIDALTIITIKAGDKMGEMYLFSNQISLNSQGRSSLVVCICHFCVLQGFNKFINSKIQEGTRI